MFFYCHPPSKERLSSFFAAALFFLFLPQNVFSEERKTLSKEQLQILQLSVKDLLQTDVIVTSPSKRPQLLHDTASAVFVVTQEDIRRTGAVNIMEALRIVPGVQVSKINQNRYAISIRGFNRRLGSDKLLVLIDNRTVYSPSASGVFWIGQDTVLEDIDRIEVIRGPGAALWGSNAVAGVINIITKDSRKTPGWMISGGLGTEERGFATVRYGFKWGEQNAFRMYGKYRSRDDGKKVDGSDSFDDKIMSQGGFRGDFQLNPRNNLTVQGDYYDLNAELDFKSRFISIAEGSGPFSGGTIQKGANFLSRWTHNLDDTSSIQAQFYYDRLERRSTLPFQNIVDQFDVDLQHNFNLGKRQTIVWGLNYRFSFFNFEETNVFRIPNKATNLVGLFFHDEISIIPEKWSIIVGAKFEYNEFSGFEFQPNIRTIASLSNRHTVWSAVSRAVRIPSITEELGFANRAVIPGAPPILLQESNDGRTDSEKLLSFEIGHRFKANPNLSFDTTAYLFKYEDLIETTQQAEFFEATPAPPHLVIPFLNDNSLEGESYGVEFSAEWKIRGNWKVAGSYTFIETDLRPTKDGAFIPSSFNSEGDLDAEGEPKHHFNIRSYLNLPYNLEFDSTYYFTSKNDSRKVKAYSRLDLRLGWKANKNLEISLVGQNILDDQHSELNELLEADSETERSFYAKLKFNF